MTATRRRVLEESKAGGISGEKAVSSRTTRRTRDDGEKSEREHEHLQRDLSVGSIKRGINKKKESTCVFLFGKKSISIYNFLPRKDLLLFFLASIIESAFFYIYVTLFTPLLRPLLFDGHGHKMIMSYLGDSGLLPYFQRYNVIYYLDILFEWLGTWEHSNQQRFLTFSSSFIFGYVFYRGYEICPTYTIVNYHLGRYPGFGTMLGSLLSSTFGGVLGGYLLFYLSNVKLVIPIYLLDGIGMKDYTVFPVNTFFGELLLSFIYSLGVSIVCRVGPRFPGAAELSWFSNANLSIMANSFRAPGNLTLTYSALYGSFSGDYLGAIILGSANIIGALLINSIFRENPLNNKNKIPSKNKKSSKR
ncbi:hypothetical protein FG386_001890 [Cryptosporidium ryanae]|uniref:uncharacterized protein n=1 Tax=Cryptosporidium ryanae TaxID=515981 RepID=UPI00351A00D8|nr:hypothetical protein FG386_001890 [Cryptosporidium ryanae]